MTAPARLFDGFRSKEAVLRAAERLRAEVRGDRRYRFMEFCGGHTHVVFRYGLRALLPPNLALVHGPGCPVCVLPRGRIDAALALAAGTPEVILCTYADLMRVPGSAGQNLIQCKAAGASIRMVYSPRDALEIARRNADRKVVFLAIGFETTAPATALAILEAEKSGLRNFFVHCLHLLTPPAIAYILEAPQIREHGAVEIDGFIGPGHVSAVIGTQPYEYFAEEYQKPVVVTGFAPLDLLEALSFLVRGADAGPSGARVVNQYRRVVSDSGNEIAKAVAAEVFELRPRFEWRGLGMVPYSAFRIRGRYAAFDAEQNLDVPEAAASDHPACLCGAILRGVRLPTDCKLFGKACTPDNPMGSCMVSSEGTCAAYYAYGQEQ